MLLSKEIHSQENKHEDILLRFQRKAKKEDEEITSNMHPEKIADIISDKLIRKIQESFTVKLKEEKI